MVVKRKYIFTATRFGSILNEFTIRVVDKKKYNKFPYNEWRSLNRVLDWARDNNKDVIVLIEPDFKADIIIGDYEYQNCYNANSLGKFLYDFLDESWDDYRICEAYDDQMETTISEICCNPITSNTISNAISANLDNYYTKAEIDWKIDDLNSSIANKADIWAVGDLRNNTSITKDRIDTPLIKDDMYSTINETIKKYLKDTEIKNDNEKEIKNMKGFNFDFGSCANNNSIRMSMYGIAVQNVSGSWVSYDPKENKIVDVDIMNFEGVGQYMYKMPTAIDALKTGDVVIHNRKAMFITNIDENGKITAVDPHAGEEKIILPAVSPFGFNFVTKIVSMFDAFNTVNPAPSAPFGNMLPFIIMGEDKDIDPVMMMFMMNGGKGFDMNNPMMMYMLMKDKNSNFDSVLPFLLMGSMNK